MVVVAVHLYNAMERTAQVEWNNLIKFYVVLWTVLDNAMKWNSAYMDNFE